MRNFERSAFAAVDGMPGLLGRGVCFRRTKIRKMHNAKCTPWSWKLLWRGDVDSQRARSNCFGAGWFGAEYSFTLIPQLDFAEIVA